MDLYLTFGYLDTLPDGNLVIKDQMAVRMSPGQFKVLCEGMNIHLKLWEEYFGKIPVAPNVAGTEERFRGQFEAVQRALAGSD